LASTPTVNVPVTHAKTIASETARGACFIGVQRIGAEPPGDQRSRAWTM
jgi:hypothetical protein